MGVLGNILWIILGGLVASIIWAISGLLLCISIIGIPFGIQCFKIASLVLAPFGRVVQNGSMGACGVIGNIIWIVLFGWELALTHIIFGCILGITVIGIPFAVQHFKLAQLSLVPFGAQIR